MIQTKPLKILLIEDDEDDYILTRDVLEDIDNFEFHLDWINNPTEGQAEIIKSAHDIYFIDFRLGEIDGLELIKIVRPINNNSPFILLTGKGDRKIDQQAMDIGASDFLVKTELSPSILERTIRYAINNSKTLQLVKDGERKFKQLFERSIDAIYIANQDDQLLEVNPSFIHLFGEIKTGKKLMDFFVEEVKYKEYQERLTCDGQIKDFEALLKIENRQEPIFCLLTSVEQIDLNSNHVGYQGIIRDISFQKRAEGDLIMAEKLSMTGKLARSIAHEVRNPLTNLGLALEQLEDELPKGNEDIEMFLNIIDRNSKRIGSLITEMLNSSKPKKLHIELTDLNELLKETVELIKDRITLQNMNVSTHLSADLPKLKVDQDKLKMAFLNIMVNAVEAMEENKGTLLISTRSDGREVTVSIHDNGKGMSKDELRTLFDAFYTNKPGGMGLGLTSTHNIIQSHNGKIEVSSDLGHGTNFTISLPVLAD